MTITREDYIEAVKLELIKLLEDGEPCDNPTCLEYTETPCERCGRIAGIRKKEDLNE